MSVGNVDGDNAAAMRYTEAKLTEVAKALLKGIDQDTVDFRTTYDGEESEPIVLPAAFPNLLANGTSGIAVGMATNVPPHNVVELCDALLHLIRHPNAAIEKLVTMVPGPDFPTGGILVEPKESIIETYSKGRGSFRLRARWSVEKGKRGSYAIVVNEIPYQVPKSRIIEKISELLQSRKLPLLADVRDESTEDIRLVLEPRSGKIEAEVVMEHLFKLTDLEVRVGFNFNVLDYSQTPRIMNLKEALQAYLDHRSEVLIRATKYRLNQIDRRIEVLDGYLVCYLNLDEVIRVIRTEENAKHVLITTFNLNSMQAESIFNMRLRSLQRLEEIQIKKEHKTLKDERKSLKNLLKDDKRRWRTIGDELRDLAETYRNHSILGPRRSHFAIPPRTEILSREVLIEKEPITVVCSQKGWIRALRGHVDQGHDARYKDGDRGRFWLHAVTTDKLIVFGTNGRFYTVDCNKLPSGRGNGEPIRLVVDLGNDQDIVNLKILTPKDKLLVASTDGRGLIVKESQIIAQTKMGKQVLNVAGVNEAKICTAVQGDHVATIGENHKLNIFKLSEIPEMSRGRGVVLQRFKDGGLSDARVFDLNRGLSWRQGGTRMRTLHELDLWLGKRGNAGRLAPKGFPKTNRFGYSYLE